MSRSFGHAVSQFRRFTSLAAISAAALALSGCSLISGGDSAESSSTNPPEQRVVRFAGLPATERALIHLADEKGFFAAEGLQVQIQDIANGSEGVEKLTRGEVDFSAGSYTSYIQAVSKGADIKLASELLVSKPNLAPVMALPDSKLQRPQDAPGKKIATAAPGSIAELAAKAVLRDKGVDFTRTQWIPMNFTDMTAALQRGDVDGAVMAEPFATDAARILGAVRIYDIFSGSTEGFPVSGVATTGDFARKAPNTVKAFQRALRNAKAAAKDKYEIADVLRRHTKVGADTAPLIELGQFAPSTNAGRLQRVATLMHSFQLTPQEVDVSKIVLPQPPPLTTQ